MYNWVSILIPFFVGLIRFKNFNKPLRLVFYFVLYGTVNEIVVRILIYYGLKNTMPSTHLYMMVSFLILMLFYNQILKEFIRDKIVIVVLVLFEMFCILNLLFFQNILEYPAIPRAVATLIIMVLSIIFYFKVMVEAKISSLWKEPLIWINAGILIWYSGNLFFSILFNLILEYSREFSKITTHYYAVIMSLFYILIAIGFWKAGKQKAVN